MENLLKEQDVKRGIDFSARMGRTLAGNLEEKFSWWGGSGWSNLTLIFLLVVFLLDLFIVFPVFTKNLNPSFASSAILTIAFMSEQMGFLKISQFLQYISIFALLFAPISIYFFVRKNTNHDLTAFLATLLFILPNPFLKEGMPLLKILLLGDGSHALAFAFMPLILLLAQEFFSRGLTVFGVIAALMTSAVAVISPFSAFNLLCLLILVALTEGFLGRIRIKIARLGFIFVSSIALTSFWYFPDMLNKIMQLDHVEITIRRITSTIPIAIPVIPVFGTVSFLIFDRRIKLKPVFLSTAIFLFFYLLYTASTKLHINGIFTTERYIAGLMFGAAFLLAVIATPLIEMLIRNCIKKMNKMLLFLLMIPAGFALITILGSGFSQVQYARQQATNSQIKNQVNKGIGSLGKNKSNDIFSQAATGVSFATLFIFIFILIRYPAILAVKDN